MTAAESARLQTALASHEPLNWVITGDSITHGLRHTQGARSYAEHMHELIRGELGRARDIVINSGISGHKVAQILGDFDRRVASWHPDVVTLMIGTNDCKTTESTLAPADFAASIADFVARVRALGAIPVLLTPPSVDVAAAPERARIGEFAQVIRDVAARDDVILVDQYARFAEIGGGTMPWALMNDPFHPNAAGHAVLALELASALGIRPEGSRVLPLLAGQVTAATLV